jgi:hypothetical protein
MWRVIFISLVLALIGVWVHPLLTGATGTPTHRPMPRTAAAESPEFERISGTRGFWRIGRTTDGVWWFLSPNDTPEFMNTVTTVQPFQLARDAQGAHFVSRDWDGGESNQGDFDAWARATLSRVRDAGFKGLGAWCNPVFHKLDVPITRDLNVWSWMKPEHRRFYSPDWIVVAEQAIRTQAGPLRDSRSLVGYFIDNELDWGDGGSGPNLYFDGLASTDPNRKAVVSVIRKLWPTTDKFNADWGTSLKDWSELDAWTSLPSDKPAVHGRLFSAWLEKLAGDYFRATTDLIRRHDPNHLILGVRFKGYAPREVVRASRNFTDAQSLNTYVSDARLDQDMLTMMNRESDQPIIISEYSFHALDGASGNRNTVGFAAQVLDQQARADAYRLYTTRLARVPYIIGADWFQWFDEPPGGRSNDGEDVNFGVVDVDDQPYPLLVGAIRDTTPRLNPLHEKSTDDYRQDVWRESFTSKPVMRVPYLSDPIRLNGELSDWPASCRLLDVRHSQTVGLERSTIPPPNVYLGWREEGLYMGIEMFDRDIQGAPAKGWWWTRDHIEFWISSRLPSATQDFYDAYSHQFFFVPIDFPGPDGVAGVVGQWHRSGDALADHLIPHPLIKDTVRILPDRYVVEMFIPAKAINGFDPIAEPTLAFNLHARNFQHATDYFWSAPKEVMTQLRPNTWGTLYLEPRPQTARR